MGISDEFIRYQLHGLSVEIDSQTSSYEHGTCIIHQGIESKEYNVTEDRDALQELVRLTNRRRFPVIRCGNEVMVGFDPGRLDQMINCAKQQTSIQEYTGKEEVIK